jgi:hypothetical protein
MAARKYQEWIARCTLSSPRSNRYMKFNWSVSFTFGAGVDYRLLAEVDREKILR